MQLDWPILSVLVWLPVAAGVLLLLVGERGLTVGRWIALAASLATFAISVLLWREFDSRTASMQFSNSSRGSAPSTPGTRSGWMASRCR